MQLETCCSTQALRQLRALPPSDRRRYHTPKLRLRLPRACSSFTFTEFMLRLPVLLLLRRRRHHGPLSHQPSMLSPAVIRGPATPFRVQRFLSAVFLFGQPPFLYIFVFLNFFIVFKGRHPDSIYIYKTELLFISVAVCEGIVSEIWE